MVADTNAGKSPFWHKVLDKIFTSMPGQRCVLESHKQLFMDGGKGIYCAKCTNADFAKRMHESKGCLFWGLQEAHAILDTPWAMGKNLRPEDKEKVDYGYLLDTQNGWAYGPVSIKGEKHQYFAPTTNFGMFHAAQPRAIHEFWGAAFTQGCPFGGMGWETRPTFWWARSHKDDEDEGEDDGDDNAHTTAFGFADFVISLLLVVAAAMGQQQHHRNFHESPMMWTPTAAPMWKRFTRQCSVSENKRNAGVLPWRCWQTLLFDNKPFDGESFAGPKLFHTQIRPNLGQAPA